MARETVQLKDIFTLRFWRSLTKHINSYANALTSKLKAAGQRAQAKAKSAPQHVRDAFRSGRMRRRILAFKMYLHGTLAFWVCAAITGVLAAGLVARYWSALDGYLSGLEKSVVPEMVIEIGVAITGIIAIAFSLSLFAIQQVADRGTPATVQAYARDRVMKFIYWALVLLATTCFTTALLKADKTYHTLAVVIGLVSLFASFVLLNLHFKRVVRFADPRYTISRIQKQGEKELRKLQMLRDYIGHHS